MIELIASGPVRVVEDVDVRRQDGWDPIHGTVRTTRELEVRVDLEFPQGHVNLEGYAPSTPGGEYVHESLEHYVSEAIDPPARGGGVRVDIDAWDVELAGEWFDWIQQAHRYQVERPDMSIIDCLALFREWDETSTNTLVRAIGEAQEVTHLTGVPPSEMSDGERHQLTGALRAHDRYLDGAIAYSYRPEQSA